MTPPRRSAALVLALVLAACSSGSAATPTPAPTAAPTTAPVTPTAAPAGPTASAPTAPAIGPAEQTELTIGFRFPNATFYIPQLIAMSQGYFADEGLKIKELVTAADLGAGLAGNSIDIALEWPEAPYQALGAKLPMTIISGMLCRTRVAFAVQPKVKTVQDLDGKDVTLAGTSGDLQAKSRKAVLKANGWDLDSVKVQYVFPGGGSEVWRGFFENGQIALMPYFSDDYLSLKTYGANFIVDTLVKAPRGVLVARPDWVKANPNTVARYLRALIRAEQYLEAPALGEEPTHRAEMQKMLADNGITDIMSPDPYAFIGDNMCPNLYIDSTTWDYLLTLYGLDPLPLDKVSNLEPLFAAQKAMGLTNNPPPDIKWPPAP